MLQNKIMRAYIATTASYGFVRKMPYTWDAKTQHYDYKAREYRMIPMLTTDKFMVSVIGAASSAGGWWPVFIYKDINRLEMRMRGHNPEIYGIEYKHTVDYIFA